MEQVWDNKSLIGKWTKDLQKKLNDLLHGVVPNQTLRYSLLTYNAMHVWNVAFTHQCVDKRHNYETLEYIGDHVSMCCFTAYMMYKYGVDMSSTTNSQLLATYMDKSYQGKLAIEMKITDYVRLYVNRNPEQGDLIKVPYLAHDPNRKSVGIPFLIGSDVFESFFAALFINGKSIGFQLFYKFMDSLFADKKIDVNRSTMSSITEVEQIFKVLKLPAVTSVQATYGKSTTVSVGEEAIRTLQSVGINLPPQEKLAVTSTKNSKFLARKECYDKLMDTFRSIGLTANMAKMIKIFFMEIREYTESFTIPIRDFMASEKLSLIYFQHSTNT